MKLKEAFRYQNALKSWIESAEYFLMDRDNVVKIKETHKRSIANPDVNDEIKEINNRSMDVTPNTIIDFLFELIVEKNKVSLAISEAKRKNDVDLDATIEINKTNQRLAKVYKNLSNIKNTERVRQDKAYKFNAEGNQTPYYYDVEEVTSIDYDRDKVRKLQKKIEAENDSKSTEIESLQLNIEVNHTPKYDVNDSFEDLVESLSN